MRSTIRHLALLAVGCAVLAMPLALCAQGAARAVPAAPWREHAFTSQVLKEQRRLFVALPDGYQRETRRYPVLWLLDANDRDQFTAALANVRFLAGRDVIPPMIVVGVANGSDRSRDMTPAPDAATKAMMPTAGGMDRFLDFIETEAKPVVARAYRVAPYTVFAGHSLGGLTGVYAAGARPALAHGIIAMSPSLWINDGALITPWAEAVARRTAPLRLFVTRGGHEIPIDVSAARFDAVLDSLLARQPNPAVAHGQRRYPDDPHSMTPLASLTDGLRYVFATYSMAVTDIERIPDFLTADSARWAAALQGTERQWAARRAAFPPDLLGEPAGDDALPESYFETATSLASFNRGGALAFAARAVALRPASSSALRVMGEVQAIRGDTVAARRALGEALVRARATRDTAAVTRAQKALQKLGAAGGPATH